MVYIDKKKFNIYYDVEDIRIKSALFEVDEFLAPIISTLNKNKYKTTYCCSGHLDKTQYQGSDSPNSDCYIIFKKHYDILDNLPSGFEIEPNSNKLDHSCTIRKYYTKEDRFYEIIDTMMDLYDWVKSNKEEKHE